MSKGPDAFRTISEAATEVGVAQHVLRFWETKFSFIRPMKRAGGRRFYRPHDLVVLRGVRRLLYDDGYTIMGVQRLHRERGVGKLIEAGGGVATPTVDVAEVRPAQPGASTGDLDLAATLALLEAAKARLDGVLGEG